MKLSALADCGYSFIWSSNRTRGEASVGEVLTAAIALAFVVVFWFVPSYFAARYAQSKGHSFAAFLLVGLLIGWVFSWIAALVVSDKSRSSIV